MTDESIINLSDETKSSLRIYATMAGFFVMMATMLYIMVALSSGAAGSTQKVAFFGSMILLIIGVTLALLHKRDLLSAFFILSAFFEMISGVGLASGLNLGMAILAILVALAFLQNRNEQAYVVSGLLLIRACLMICIYTRAPSTITVIPAVLIVVVSLYFTIALACEKYKLPLRDYLVADDEKPESDGTPVHFKEMGSSIGYALWALFALMNVFAFFHIGSPVGEEFFNTLEPVLGAIFVVTGVIMMVAGRMKGTPFYFICAGFLFFMMSAGMSYVEPVCMVILGIMMMLRQDSRILFGLASVLQGISGFVLMFSLAAPVVCGIICMVIFLILTYLVFAVNSNGKLKLI